jgi:autotransporter-associated beta strand protein
MLTGTLTGSDGKILTLAGTGSTSLSSINVSAADQFAIAGAISGSQVLTKMGAGTLTLSGANTYSGGTTINAGVLSLSPNSSLGSGVVTLAGGSLTATGTFSAANPFTVAENASITSSGNTVLTGTLSGSDGTTLTLAGTGSTSLSSINVSGTDQFAIAGAISGTQALTKMGAGTLTLSGTNTYSGGTTIDAGTLSISSLSAIGSGDVTLAGGTLAPSSTISTGKSFAVTGNSTISSTGNTMLTGTLTGSDGTTLTLAGTGSTSLSIINVNGTDQFTIVGVSESSNPTTKIGEGTLALVGAIHSDTTTVSEGQLAVLGSLTSKNITVTGNGILSGTGTINGDVNNSGMLSPGASIGTLHIVGSYVQAPQSHYLNEINLTTSDKLSVDGNVTFYTNSTFLLSPDPLVSPYITGTHYTIIEAKDGWTLTVIGEFDYPVTSSAPLITGFLYQKDNQIILVIGLKEISLAGIVGNSAAVARNLDVIGSTANPAVDGIFASILPLSEVELNSALNQMHPALYKGLAIVQENNAVQVRNAISQRLQVALNKSDCGAPREKQKKTHLWVAGIGNVLKQASTTSSKSPQVGYQSNSSGFVSGVDYHFAENCYIGGLGAYTHSSMKWQNKQGQAEIDSGYTGLYLAAMGKLFYGNLSVMGAWSGYDAQRKIAFAGVNETASNSHRGTQLTSHIDMGLNLTSKGFTIRPFDSLDLIVQRENAFTEQGADEYNLAVRKMHATMLRNELGVNLAASYCFKGINASFDAKLGWIREMSRNNRGLESKFNSSPMPTFFTVNGYFPNRNLVSVGANISAITLKEQLTCTLYYNGEFGQKYSDHGIGGELSLGF